MKAKLIKQDNEWHLFVNHLEPKITPFAKYPWDITKQRLSLKNCQVIERGYDLDELLKKEISNGKLHPNDGAKKEGIERGIQIALEIFGDKKFTEGDMERMSLATSEWENSEIEYGKDVLIRKVFKLLQQTEWDVEIVTFTEDDLKSVSEDWGKLGKPKLDADGCLILKRI